MSESPSKANESSSFNDNKRKLPKNSWKARQGKSRRRHPYQQTQQQQQQHGQVSIQQPPTCSVCNINTDPKYKCPKCRATYCSVACCRKHKEIECGGATAGGDADETASPRMSASTAATAPSRYLPNLHHSTSCTVAATLTALRRKRESNDNSSNNNNDHKDDGCWEDGWRITNDMKQQMKHCEWLRTELQDEGLRRLIGQVYETSNRVVGRQKHSQTTVTTEREQKLEQLGQTYPPFRRFLDKLLVLTGVLERQGDDAAVALDHWLAKEENKDAHHLVLKPLVRQQKQRPAGTASGPARDGNGCSNGGNHSQEAEEEESSCSENGSSKDGSF